MSISSAVKCTNTTTPRIKLSQLEEVSAATAVLMVEVAMAVVTD